MYLQNKIFKLFLKNIIAKVKSMINLYIVNILHIHKTFIIALFEYIMDI